MKLRNRYLYAVLMVFLGLCICCFDGCGVSDGTSCSTANGVSAEDAVMSGSNSDFSTTTVKSTSPASKQEGQDSAGKASAMTTLPVSDEQDEMDIGELCDQPGQSATHTETTQNEHATTSTSSATTAGTTTTKENHFADNKGWSDFV